MPFSPSPVVRRATPADAQALIPLFEAYRCFFTGSNDLPGSARFLRERLEAGDSAVFAAFIDGAAAGFVQLYPLFSSWYARSQWFLSDLFVERALRQRGIGKELVGRAIQFARSNDSRAMLVELPFSEPHLAEFYAAFGFSKDPVFDLYRLTMV